MRVRSFGAQALLLECGGTAGVRAAYAEALRRREAGELTCTDIVPAARTLLLDGLADPAQVTGGLDDWPTEPPVDEEGELVELEVSYDGPDLESVARLTGLSTDEVVRHHSETEFVVAFCGFAPGFAYLAGLPEELEVPRLEEPRSRVPAGSVGLAGQFTGVYPRSSPGGWQLIARTGERLWDVERDPPALLAPGTRVRFTQGEQQRALEVTDAGLQVTVQDLGRAGQAHLGVPRSGALDEPAHRLANRLVGNPESAATLECLGGRVAVRTRSAVTIAVTGAQVPVVVDGRGREWANAVAVPAGSQVELRDATWGLRAYLAVSGGIEVEPVLCSRATDLLSGLGPAPVEEGDVLPVGTPSRRPTPVDAVRSPRPSKELRLRLGPRDDWFEPASVRTLRGSSYVVGSESNRIGLRLEGEKIRWRERGELPSEGMVLGAVQVPPNGQPVVFLNDHPTTGGYPVIGVVVADDLATCAQLRPGDEITLRVV